MKCIILAAGEGTRMLPLTLETPKPMLKVLDKPILEHIINDLPDEIDEVMEAEEQVMQQPMAPQQPLPVNQEQQ